MSKQTIPFRVCERDTVDHDEVVANLVRMHFVREPALAAWTLRKKGWMVTDIQVAAVKVDGFTAEVEVLPLSEVVYE